MSRHQEDIDEREVYAVVSVVAQILTEYHDPSFHRLIQVRLAQHPGGSPSQVASHEFGGRGNRSFGFDYSEASNLAQQRAEGQVSAIPQCQIPLSGMRDETTASAGTGFEGFEGFEGVNPPDTLDQLLEAPDWMLNPSAMMVFDVARWQNQDPMQTGDQGT